VSVKADQIEVIDIGGAERLRPIFGGASRMAPATAFSSNAKAGC
jgi:hypothetical protein